MTYLYPLRCISILKPLFSALEGQADLLVRGLDARGVLHAARAQVLAVEPHRRAHAPA